MSDNQSERQANRPPTERRDVLSTEQAYSSSQVGKAIGVSSSTVRKYSITLESAGYDIIRDENNNRVYVDADLITLREMMTYIKRGVTVVNAAKAVFNERQGERVPATVKQEDSEAMRKLLEYVAKQDKMIEQQREDMKAMNDKLDKLIKVTEDKEKLLLEEKNEDKKGFFARLFK